MRHCASNTREAEEGERACSDLIDRQIEEDSKKYKREVKLLLLGACCSFPSPTFPRHSLRLPPPHKNNKILSSTWGGGGGENNKLRPKHGGAGC